MKNKDHGDSIFKKKGFFIALYSCLGAVIVLALVISFSSLLSGPSNETAEAPDTLEESANVSADQVESYLTQAQEQAQAELDEQVWKKPSPSPSATPPAAATKPPVASAAPKPPAAAPHTSAAPAASAAPAGTTGSAEESSTEESSAEESAPAAETDAEASAPVSVSESAETAGEALAFTPFTESDSLDWPVEGEVAMVFSMDKLVYDPTLDQYRTNDDLRITAQEGTPVKACAEGQVAEVGSNHEYGNYVKINHGNGWATIYGQLMEGVLVRQDDVVKTGQVIGGVGKPSYYGSLNGAHVNLRVTKEDMPVDPLNLLADGEQE